MLDQSKPRHQHNRHNDRTPDSVFLGNLSFFCTEDHLRRLLHPFGCLKSVRICKTKQNEPLHYGFGRFTTVEAATAAIEALSGQMFMGRRLRLCSGETPTGASPSALDAGVQVLVSFVSYQLETVMSEEILCELFAGFGEIVDCVVKSFVSHDVGNNKKQGGYGFVAFASRESALCVISQGTMHFSYRSHTAEEGTTGHPNSTVQFHCDCKLSKATAKRLDIAMPPSDTSMRHSQQSPSPVTSQQPMTLNTHTGTAAVSTTVVSGRTTQEDENEEDHLSVLTTSTAGNLVSSIAVNPMIGSPAYGANVNSLTPAAMLGRSIQQDVSPAAPLVPAVASYATVMHPPGTYYCLAPPSAEEGGAVHFHRHHASGQMVYSHPNGSSHPSTNDHSQPSYYGQSSVATMSIPSNIHSVYTVDNSNGGYSMPAATAASTFPPHSMPPSFSSHPQSMEAPAPAFNPHPSSMHTTMAYPPPPPPTQHHHDHHHHHNPQAPHLSTVAPVPAPSMMIPPPLPLPPVYMMTQMPSIPPPAPVSMGFVMHSTGVPAGFAPASVAHQPQPLPQQTSSAYPSFISGPQQVYQTPHQHPQPPVNMLGYSANTEASSPSVTSVPTVRSTASAAVNSNGHANTNYPHHQNSFSATAVAANAVNAAYPVNPPPPMTPMTVHAYPAAVSTPVPTMTPQVMSHPPHYHSYHPQPAAHQPYFHPTAVPLPVYHNHQQHQQHVMMTMMSNPSSNYYNNHYNEQQQQQQPLGMNSTMVHPSYC